MGDRYTLSALLRISWLALALATPTALSAQNLLSNPEFDGYGTTGDASDPFPDWNSSGITSPTAGEDADLCAASDSYRVDSTGSGRGLMALDCIAVTAGDTLHLEISHRGTGAIDLRVFQFSGPGCTDGAGTFLPPPEIPASDDWTTARVQLVVTENVQSLVYWLRTDAAAAYFTEFDRAYIGHAERVFADDFDGGSLCRWKFFEDGQPM